MNHFNDQVSRERRMGIDKEANFAEATLKVLAIMGLIVLAIELSY